VPKRWHLFVQVLFSPVAKLVVLKQYELLHCSVIR